MNKWMVVLLISLTSQICNAQSANYWLSEAQKFAKKNGINIPTNLPASAGLSNADVVKGLKEALTQGAGKGSDKVSKLDGYFKDAAIKILMPPDALKAEKKLRELGLGHIADKAILSINRAAEDAAVKAKPIFVTAITQMTFNDAMSILKGPQNAATEYLKRTTNAKLVSAFKPVIENSLQKVNATKYWADLINTYNKLPLVQKINPDLSGFVTDKAIQGIFMKVADEEKNIRVNPAARVTAILQKVFGSLTKK
jgi:hypothetical protein